MDPQVFQDVFGRCKRKRDSAVDGQNPVVNTNTQWFAMVSKWCGLWISSIHSMGPRIGESQVMQIVAPSRFLDGRGLG